VQIYIFMLVMKAALGEIQQIHMQVAAVLMVADLAVMVTTELIMENLAAAVVERLISARQ
jgi:hypothetical protein